MAEDHLLFTKHIVAIIFFFFIVGFKTQRQWIELI